MDSLRRFSLPLRYGGALIIVVACAATWMQAQSPVQIGRDSPLAVFLTNPDGLPEGFAAGSRWRFTTWTVPSVITWTASVNKTSGSWANLTIIGDDRISTTRWYYVPAMPGSWERQ